MTLMAIYNAEDQILGRFCSVLAKKALEGEDVIIVNADKAILSGGRKYKIEHYGEKATKGDAKKGPFFHRAPDKILLRTVRGMMPMKKTKGRDALKKVKVFIGVPDDLKGKEKKFLKVEEADSSGLRTKVTKLGDLSLLIGAKKRW
jgi:large subunit ribosomal protein L13